VAGPGDVYGNSDVVRCKDLMMMPALSAAARRPAGTTALGVTCGVQLLRKHLHMFNSTLLLLANLTLLPAGQQGLLHWA
jgi:hypothetical protein